MVRRNFTPEQIINKLGEAEVHIRCEDAVYRAGESMGEWVYRIVQRQAE